MTDFIFISLPWLLVAPLSVLVISAVCAVTESRLLSAVNVILHACAIAALIYFGAGLSDILVTLLVSVLASIVFGRNKAGKTDGTSTEVDAR